MDDAVTIPSAAELRQRVEAARAQTLADLADLVRIPSVSAWPDHADQVLASAEAVADLLRGANCPDVRIVAEGGQPAVIARYPAPAGRPTICLYAHHDVQPPGNAADWTSEPFRAEVRGERMYARGSADDKGGVAAHLAALRAFDGNPPVGVTLFIEGEEEIGSPTLARTLERHADLLRADVYVIADSVNWAVGQPAFSTTLRGIADVVVEVATARAPLHSGQFGGSVPDALGALIRMLDSLTDAEGTCAVEGLHHGSAADLDYPEDRLRREAGMLEGVEFVGRGKLVDRMWAKPAVTVLAIDTVAVDQASNVLLPSARAKVSLRVAPGDDARRALEALKAHLVAHAPYGARVSFGAETAGQPGVVSFEGPVAELAAQAWTEAWGTEPVQVGIGGSIPMVADFQQAFPEATVLVSAVTDPDSAMHGTDESVDQAEIGRAALAEALLMAGLAG
ncbi:dipeptidase [Aestuariimicrobium sp. Y1814]|uniref:dipeptidase n=1 Tax=Aestuariimicrobium sp. Y1814 TaxID=3418742 RepID=UPI003DA787E5